LNEINPGIRRHLFLSGSADQRRRFSSIQRHSWRGSAPLDFVFKKSSTLERTTKQSQHKARGQGELFAVRGKVALFIAQEKYTKLNKVSCRKRFCFFLFLTLFAQFITQAKNGIINCCQKSIKPKLACLKSSVQV
jgi:hypothetical protein